MTEKKVSARTLAKACGCSEEHIKGVCREGNDTPLGTFFHLNAAHFLEQDPVRLAYGNRTPINPQIQGPVTVYTLDQYQQEDEEGRALYHQLLQRAVAALPDPPARSRKKS